MSCVIIGPCTVISRYCYSHACTVINSNEYIQQWSAYVIFEERPISEHSMDIGLF